MLLFWFHSLKNDFIKIKPFLITKTQYFPKKYNLKKERMFLNHDLQLFRTTADYHYILKIRINTS